jgi:hypothetical protein
MCLKAEMCDRILCGAQKELWRDVRNVTEAMSQATVFRWWKHFKAGTEGWLMMALKVGDQALLSNM